MLKVGSKVITYENLKATVVIIGENAVTLMYDKLDRDLETLPLGLIVEKIS